LAENASDGIIITSADGGIVYANKQASEITGHTVDELLQTDIKKLAYPGRLQELLRRYKDRRKVKPVPSRYETVIVRKDGGIVPAEIAAATTTWQGKPTTMFFICDITERKRMQAQLMTQDRLASLGELVSGVAHELNNPLTSVIGFSELLLRRDLPDDIKEDLEIINDKAKLIARIVQSLLTFARKQPQEKLPIDLNERIRRVLELRAYEQKTNNIQVITRFASDLPKIMGNSFQLYQVFLNIIINAEFFMIEAHNKGTLTITTERIGDFVRATFADDGPGISKENMTHLFTPFFTTKEVGKGTGLGLSICHGIITEHGGRIYAGSELGKGATLIVELPTNQQ
jgi:PAS domain S-box-containing protein